MVFYIPQEYECLACSHTVDHSRSSPGPGVLRVPSGDVYCPFCLETFLAANVPRMVQSGRKGEGYRREET